MHERFVSLGVMDEAGELRPDRPRAEDFYAMYAKAGGEARSFDALRREGARRLGALAERGFDLGYREGVTDAPPPEIESRMRAIYRHARQALYAGLDESVIRDVSPRVLRVRTQARDREEFLRHPPSGERISEADARRVSSLYDRARPRVQVVVSDGLNANAVNENLRAVLPPLRQMLASAGHTLSDREVVIENGRVRAGYHVGTLLGVDVIVHLIGERPGTGINTLSAYLTYGRSRSGALRWNPAMDHSCTTAVCGIHAKGKLPLNAAAEIARYVERMLSEHRSGVDLSRE
jgi:ethanolamine ammonia-lyase large subunit